MHVKHAEIWDIRGIAETRLPPQGVTLPERGWIVLAGRNGTGKTTLLQAIAAGVLGGSSTFTMLGARPDGWIRANAKKAKVKLTLDGAKEDWREPKDLTGPFALTVEWSSQESSRNQPPVENHSFVVSQFWDAASFGSKPKGWMMAGYGAIRFAAAATGEAHELSRAAPRRAALATLFRREATLYVTDHWVARLHADFLEANTSNPFFDDEADRRRAKRVHAVLEGLLSDGLLTDSRSMAGRGRVRLSSRGILVQRGGSTVSVRELGLGFETLALMVSDLIRQMVGFFGDRFMGGEAWTPAEAGEPLVVPHSGVVLIDEAENHLHPELQQRLGPWLKAHFPNVQFIVTSHSPFICQAADPNGLFFVREGGMVEAVSEESYRLIVAGTVNDAILTEMFGLPAPYSPESKRIRDRLGELEAKLLTGQELSTAERAERERLLAKLPRDPGTEIDRLVAALRR